MCQSTVKRGTVVGASCVDLQVLQVPDYDGTVSLEGEVGAKIIIQRDGK